MHASVKQSYMFYLEKDVESKQLPLSTSPPLKTYNRHLISGLRASGGSVNSKVIPEKYKRRVNNRNKMLNSICLYSSQLA